MMDGNSHDLTSFYGDFYCMPDNVTRGVCLPAHSADLRQPTAQVDHHHYFGNNACFPYHLEPPDHHGLLKGLPFGGAHQQDVKCAVEAPYKTSQEAEVHFPIYASPPWMPQDPMFSLASTCILLDLEPSSSPAQLGNDLMDFFADGSEAMVSSVQKVRPMKFSVKAQVSLANLTCSVKARIYRQTSSRHAIEFQRRAGDAVAFNAIFQKAIRFYKERGYLMLGTDKSATGFSGHAHILQRQAGELLLGPGCLPEARLEDQPNLQAEAAAALAAAAITPAGIDALVHEEDEGKRVMRQLLDSEHQHIVYSMSQVLLSMLESEAAADWFACDDELWNTLQRKIESTKSTPAVRRELEKVARVALQHRSDDGLCRPHIRKDVDDVRAFFGETHLGAGLAT